MRCISPLSVRRPDGLSSKDRITVPCGKCVECLSKKRSDWSIRLINEERTSASAFFVTLTYDDVNLPFGHVDGENTYTLDQAIKEDDFSTMIPCVEKIHLVKFIKDLRNSLARPQFSTQSDYLLLNGIKIPFMAKVSQIEEKRPLRAKYEYRLKYYAVAEYGSKTERPHYHLIMFNLPLNYVYQDQTIWIETLLSEIWPYGQINVGTVTPESIGYVAKYQISKGTQDGSKRPVFSLMSKNLGLDYVKKFAQYHRETLTPYVTELGGTKHGLPRYYKDRLFNKKQKQLINEKLLKESDLNDNEVMQKLFSKGENPWEYEILQKDQITKQKLSRLTKNNKL